MQCLHNTCIVYVGEVAKESKEFIDIHEEDMYLFIMLYLKKKMLML